jgi:stearoyl-CoA desaturase (delta-9 desaturase)
MKDLDFKNIAVVAATHVLAGVALFFPNTVGIVGGLILYYVTLQLGMIICYHRMVSHRMFKAHPILEHALLMSATLGIEDGPLTWGLTHRLHHRFADTDRDPHSPRKGFFWAHIGWVFRRGVVGDEKRHYTIDLEKNPVMRFYERWHVALNFGFFGLVCAALAPFLTATEMLAALLWMFPLRIVVVWHSTWLVNSATHVWGTQPTPVGDDSRNNRVVTLVTFGEGLHNNHHAQPTNPNFGALTRQLDMSYVTMRVMAALGLLRFRGRGAVVGGAPPAY